MIDTVAPPRLGCPGLLRRLGTVTFTATDSAGGSGRWRLLRPRRRGPQSGLSVTVTGKGPHLGVLPVDVAGNAELIHNYASLNQRATDRAGDDSDAAPLYAGPATITLTATDEVGGSGVAATLLRPRRGAETSGPSSPSPPKRPHAPVLLGRHHRPPRGDQSVHVHHRHDAPTPPRMRSPTTTRYLTGHDRAHRRRRRGLGVAGTY